MLPLSVGDPSVRLDKEDERFMLDETLSIDGYWTMFCSPSSTGRHVSTIASRQLTNNSAPSTVQFDCNTSKISHIRETIFNIQVNKNVSKLIFGMVYNISSSFLDSI